MDQANDNRREFFRLGFDDLTGTMQIFEVDDNPISVDPCTVRILNVGGGGLYMRAEVDIPVRHQVYATFTFTVAGQTFTFRGHVRRKMDDQKFYWYAVIFIDVEEQDQRPLIAALQRVMVERSRKGRVTRQ